MRRSEVSPAAAAGLAELSSDFLERYNRPGPRYTSYPTAPEWKDTECKGAFIEALRAGISSGGRDPVSLYFHVPFCEKRCRFCGCNVIISRSPETAERYRALLDAEMEILVREAWGGHTLQRPVSQVHFGGGTPTHLSPDQIRRLFDGIRGRFEIQDSAEIAIEADPCETSEEHLRTLSALGFNRISFGVQDFHLPTQQAIDRVQTVEETRHVTELARELGFESVNYDLIYGLPLQTAESFGATLDRVIDLRPDRVALYNFAYLPQFFPHQRTIRPEELPQGPEKFRIFAEACERFLAEGYVYIGMDHFARPDDALTQARKTRTLQRNFMGYTTRAGNDLYAFGVSAISMTDRVYVQNLKSLRDYREQVASGRLPIERGIALTEDDRLRRDVIQALMCHGEVVKSEIEAAHSIEFDAVFGAEMKALEDLQRDGLVELQGERVTLTFVGCIFARNVAMVFDARLRSPRAQHAFSRTL